MSKKPNYRAFAKDMMKLCEKHGIKMSAWDEGMVLLGPATGKAPKDFPYSTFRFSPTEAFVGEGGDDNLIHMSADTDDDNLINVEDPVLAQVRKYLNAKVPVGIKYTDENGAWMWSVHVRDDQAFWLDAFDTEAKARAWCALKGLPIVESL